MSKVGDNKVLVFIGKRNSGKSMLVLDYLSHNLGIPIGMVISPTDEYNRTFHDRVPEMFIHNEVTPELLQSFLDRQKKKSKEAKENPNIDPRAFLILDDCMFDSANWVNDSVVKFLFMNGRHVNVTLIITLQDPVGITPKLRSNIDFIFLCKEPTKQNREKLLKLYCGMFDNIKQFEDVMQQVCENYNVLVVNRNSHSYNLEDQVYWYRANLERVKMQFRCCHPVYWKANEELKMKKEQIEADKEKEERLKAQSKKGNYTLVRRLEQTVDNLQ